MYPANYRSSRHQMIDLHGLTVKQTKELLQKTFSKIKDEPIKELYIITGRGNHANSDGQRGVLNKILPKLLKPYCNEIQTIDRETGSYRILLKEDIKAKEGVFTDLLNFISGDPKHLQFLEDAKQKAKADDIDSLELLAMTYLYSTIPEYQNVEEGLRLLHKAKDLGSLDAWAMLGTLYLKGEKVPVDYNRVRKYLPYAAERGNPLAQAMMAHCYVLGQAFKYDDKKVIEWLTKAAEQNMPEANFNLGRSYFEGNYVERDDKLAIKYLTKAAQMGYPDSFSLLARCYACGYGVDVNYTTALELYEAGAYYEDIYCLAQAGAYYGRGRGTTVDNKKSYEYSLRAAELGDTDSQANVGAMLLVGKDDVLQNVPEGIKWLEMAVKNKQPLALYMLGIAYRDGSGVPQDANRAWQLIQEAAELNNESAQFVWGMHLFKLNNSKEEAELGLQWIEKSAQQNHLPALLFLKEVHKKVSPDTFVDYDQANSIKEKGNIHASQRNFQAALDCYNEAVSLQPNFTVAWFNKGLMHKNLSQFQAAKEAFEKALALDPYYDKASHHLGLLLAEENQLAAAWKRFNDITKRNPQHFESKLQALFCGQKIGARVIFAKVDLKLTKDGKIKILEFNRGMLSGIKSWNNAIGTDPLKLLKQKTQQLNLPETIIDPFADSAPAHLDTLIHNLKLKSISSPKDFSPDQLTSYESLYISSASRKLPDRVLAVDDPWIDMIFEDKILMHESFVKTGNESARPRALIFPKHFSKNLAKTIRTQLPGVKCFVFKSPDKEGGRGVLIVPDHLLNSTIEVLALISRLIDENKNSINLLQLFNPPISDGAKELLQTYMGLFNFWMTGARQCFMVEEYVVSKPVLENSNLYDATFSALLLAVRDQGSWNIEPFASCWTLPPQPINHRGELRDKTIASFTLKHNKVKTVTEEDATTVYQQLKNTLPIVFEHMLIRDLPGQIVALPANTEKEKEEKFDLYLHLANSLAYHGHYQIALYYITEYAEKLNIEQDRVLHTKGVVYHLQGNYTLALESFNLALSMNERNGATYYRRGKTLLALNRREEAQQDFTKCLKIDDRYIVQIEAIRAQHSLNDESVQGPSLSSPPLSNSLGPK